MIFPFYNLFFIRQNIYPKKRLTKIKLIHLIYDNKNYYLSRSRAIIDKNLISFNDLKNKIKRELGIEKNVLKLKMSIDKKLTGRDG
jgi:hypothetical protein